MHRVEITIFAASEPISRETLARIVGKNCNFNLIIDDVHDELRSRPYDLASVAGGWKHLTRPAYADAIRSAFGTAVGGVELTRSEVLVLMCTPTSSRSRVESCRLLSKEISRDLIGFCAALA